MEATWARARWIASLVAVAVQQALVEIAEDEPAARRRARCDRGERRHVRRTGEVGRHPEPGEEGRAIAAEGRARKRGVERSSRQVRRDQVQARAAARSRTRPSRARLNPWVLGWSTSNISSSRANGGRRSAKLSMPAPTITYWPTLADSVRERVLGVAGAQDHVP